MRLRAIAFALALIAASAARAEWAVLGEGDDYALYLDPGSLRKDGETFRIWVLQEFKKPTVGSGARSFRLLEQGDCRNRRVRTLSSSLHTGPKATGDVLNAETMRDEAWRPAAPGTLAGYVLEEVCGPDK